MKTIVAFLVLLVVFITSAFSQSEKTVAITDIRSQGVSLKDDLPTAGRKDGDIIVNRETRFSPAAPSGTNMLDTYSVHIFKNYYNTLKEYLMLFGDTGNYDQASFKWINDTIVSVHLVNSVTQKINKGWNIYRQGSRLQPYFGELPSKSTAKAKAIDPKTSVKYNCTFRFTRPDPPYNDYDTVITFTFANESEYNAWKENAKDAIKVEKVK